MPEVPPVPFLPERSIGVIQMLIAFGKYESGLRPGEEGWTEYDQDALEAARSGAMMYELHEDGRIHPLPKSLFTGLEESDG